MKRFLLLLFFGCGTGLLRGQIRNDSLEYRIRPDSGRTGDLYLSVNNFNFLRNYEFFNHFQDGYTLYGLQLEPQLVYFSNPNLVVTAGIHARKDFGNQGIYKTYPLFSLKYQKRNTALIAGVLEGSIEHRYIEPIFDFERKITDPVEYGTQMVVNSSRLFLDAWVSWKRMIYKPSPEQEQILAGVSSDVTLFKKNNFRLSLPVQLIAFHQGGQIDTLNKPLQTLVNSAAGFKISYETKGFVRTLRTENYVTGFNELSPTKVQPFSNGSGLYLNGGADTRAGSLTVSYWKAKGFNSPLGMPLFQSVSQQINRPGLTQKNRELLFLRYAFQKQLVPNLYLDFRVEPVFFLDNSSSKTFEFYHSLFLVYRQQFRLLKKK